MGQGQSGMGGGDGRDEKDKKKDKPKYEPPPRPTTRVGRKKRKAGGTSAAAKLPAIYPTSRCKLRLLRMQRIHDHLLLEEEYVENQERLRKAKAAKEGAAVGPDADVDRLADERGRVDDMRGSPMGVGTLEELIDDDHAIVSSTTGPEYYVSIMSFVDKDLLEPGASVLLHHKTVSIVGVLTDDTDPIVSVMKLDKAPTESYADIGGLESQIQEVRESVELPLLHPELYEEMGIKPPKGVILYGAPGTGKTLLAKAVANQTSATFLRIVGSELIQKYLGDGPRLVRQLFQVAGENAPSIVFIDEIDAIGTKRYESTSGGEREVQRTMLELLNQLDGFDDRGDVKVIMATNKIDTLDPALIRPGRIDRKILFENPDQNTKRKIFTLHTSKMNLNDDVDLEEFISQKDDLSGADIKAICSEAGMMALRERRMRVQMADFRSARERVLRTKQEGEPEAPPRSGRSTPWPGRSLILRLDVLGPDKAPLLPVALQPLRGFAFARHRPPVEPPRDEETAHGPGAHQDGNRRRQQQRGNEDEQRNADPEQRKDDGGAEAERDGAEADGGEQEEREER
ncbi:proteasome regulatory particle subunit Rpt2 [Metarhizium album ARSEF 1941]|uniref:26S proteasome regulatory subunit 4 homolog n=1 Tax=Metarhizium album (strain ARSEF 1941) TaxID=1081103 RepID=A0A0B2WUV2_METAS|nr:proteasome regulatory particle subunit Rpt2 [Metarhizium album ARSEF 1941]KHN97237.1 proteasome regulatory particle subunit Rpt2 [Metarhizium album ARSEF 1941]